jgi:hypothetical protein
MTERTPEDPILDLESAAFVEHYAAIFVAGCGAGNLPILAAACGCRVAPDRRLLSLFLSEEEAGPVEAGLRHSGAVAAVFSRPSTHRGIQIKGHGGRIEPLRPGDPDLIERWRASYIQDLMAIGYGRDFATALTPQPGARPVVLTFAPEHLFDQTPGRQAGRRLA